MINRSIELEATLRLALEALENLINQHYAETTTNDDLEKADNAITTIKEALAQPEQRSVSEQQEPVAWRVRWPKVGGGHAWVMNDAPLMAEHGFVNEPLYTTPPTQQSCSQRTTAEGEDTRRAWVNATTWRGLTSEEIRQLEKENTVNGYHGDYCPTWDLIQATEAKLKEKNTRNGGCL